MPHTRLFDVVPENSVRFLGHDTHTHPVPHLIHVVSGTADLVVDGAPVHLDAKENLWLAADVPHSAQYAPDSVVLGPFLSPGTTPPVPMRVLGVVPRLTEIARMILGASPRTDAQIRVFRDALDEVLLDLDAPYFVLRMPAHPVARDVARAAVASDLTLERLAARRRHERAPRATPVPRRDRAAVHELAGAGQTQRRYQQTARGRQPAGRRALRRLRLPGEPAEVAEPGVGSAAAPAGGRPARRARDPRNRRMIRFSRDGDTCARVGP
nr:AraC family ligand binding domain-containing protein [Leucobacter sp. UCD-THU]